MKRLMYLFVLFSVLVISSYSSELNNEITSYRGKMFDGVTTVTSSSMGFTADPEWGGTNEYEF